MLLWSPREVMKFVSPAAFQCMVNCAFDITKLHVKNSVKAARAPDAVVVAAEGDEVFVAGVRRHQPLRVVLADKCVLRGMPCRWPN